jgi:hypothetical protein
MGGLPLSSTCACPLRAPMQRVPGGPPRGEAPAQRTVRSILPVERYRQAGAITGHERTGASARDVPAGEGALEVGNHGRLAELPHEHLGTMCVRPGSMRRAVRGRSVTDRGDPPFRCTGRTGPRASAPGVRRRLTCPPGTRCVRPGRSASARRSSPRLGRVREEPAATVRLR